MKNIVLLGASGSIGMQTIDVCVKHSDKFKIVALSVGANIDALRKILSLIDVRNVCLKQRNESLEKQYPNIVFSYGDEGLLDLVALDYDLLVNALVGFVGLKPTIKAIELKRDVALANKETLVVGGEFVMKKVKENNVKLLPIDSEHSAIFQALQGNDIRSVERLIITASGGSFRELDRSQLGHVTRDDALNHPNWSMGAKITIDSATMMNKGFEVIEAHWLFDIPYHQISVVMHPQSIVHSIVEYIDGLQMAQLGLSDMRLPIQYALSYPSRINLASKRLKLEEVGSLTFKELSFERFPLLKVAYEVGQAKGNAPCILNAANEIANQSFLDGRISFIEIEEVIIDALKNIPYVKDISLNQIYDYDKITRDYVLVRISKKC